MPVRTGSRNRVRRSISRLVSASAQQGDTRLNTSQRLATAITTGVAPDDRSERQVTDEFRRLLDDGARLLPSGLAKDDPGQLLTNAYLPRHVVELFGTRFYLTSMRLDDDLNFVVGYVTLAGAKRTRAIHPRIFYKDPSLVWRVATHLVRSENDNWIGKGDLKWVREDGEDVQYSAEETTTLPFELQAAFDQVSRAAKPRRDHAAVPLILRWAPEDRVRPYADFSAPRARAREGGLVNGGRYVARFLRDSDPGSLRFARGYEPDFQRGVLEVARTASKLYGGAIRKFRILSTNRKIQYMFVVGPKHVWINPPQTLTTELSTYGVRTLDVEADERLFIPGFEYHYMDDGELHSQIPVGWVGNVNKFDSYRADASPWIEAMPVIKQFRATVLTPRGRRKRSK